MVMREQIRLQFAERLRHASSRSGVALWLAAFLMGVVAGPFGTFRELDAGARALFWALVVTAAMLGGHVARAVSQMLVRDGQPDRVDAVTILLMTAMVAPAVWAVFDLFQPPLTISEAPFLKVVLYVCFTTLVVVRLRRVLPIKGWYGAGPATSAEEGIDAQIPPEPRLADRLDREIQGTILRISAKDHHVEIATEKGTQTLRMRLMDAIGQMGPVEGYCTHRSHWVTREAIARVERESARRTWIYLINGDRVPVGRKYRPDLEAAGIL